MKKFYESPVVELAGFSAEDVITTSVVTIDTTGTLDVATVQALESAVTATYGAGKNTVADYSSYTW